MGLVFTGLPPGYAQNSQPPDPAVPSYKIMFLLPVRDNQGKSFPQRDYTAIEEDLLRIAGGYTFQGIVKGAFRLADGRISREASRQYFVTSPQPEAIRRILADAARRFSQEALYSEITQPEVVLIRPAPDAP